MKQLTSLTLSLFLCSGITAQIKEPYRPLHDGNYVGAPVSASPDPTIRYRWNAPGTDDSLELYFLQPKKITSSPSNIFRQTGATFTVTGKGNLLLDFGMENAGWLEFESDDIADSVEMSISEYNEPAIFNTGAQTPVKTKAPVRYGNTYRLELNDKLYEGVRFGWIHVKNFSKPWHIKNIRLVCQVKPVNYQGSFYSSDTLLNRIWYTGAYVVKLNLLQDYFGAILIDRSDRFSWTGDAYPSQAAALAAFGNYDAVKKNLAFTSGQDNGIASYSLYWVLSLMDYFNYTGDTAFLKAYTANADKRLEKAYGQYDSQSALGFTGWDERLGAGFENPQIKENQNVYRMLCINAWNQFAKALSFIGAADLAAKYQQYAATKIRQLQTDTIHQFGVHAISEAINAGLLNDSAVARRSQTLFSDRLNRLSYSPFNQYFIIEAMALANEYTRALTTIKDQWGGQIAYGGTSFFEVFRPSWNAILHSNDAPPNNQCGYTSLAHPWGAGVTKWLSENILGIKPLTPGFKTFTILPYLQGTLSSVRGDMPTPSGTIHAAFDSKSGVCEITIPSATTAAKIGLPKAGRTIRKVTINGKPFPLANTPQDQQYIYLTNLQPGSYNIQVDYAPARMQPAQPAEPFHYSITAFSQDSLTAGNWKSRYGQDGYKLLGYPNNSGHEKLPSFIDSITTRLNGAILWDSSTAAIITRDPIACLQTMTIDVHAKKGHPYKLSLYFLDFDKKSRRSAVEIFDLNTLDIIAPVQMVRNYQQGKYLSFVASGPIRIRVNQVRGQNASVSGVFFDRP